MNEYIRCRYCNPDCEGLLCNHGVLGCIWCHCCHKGELTDVEMKRL